MRGRNQAMRSVHAAHVSPAAVSVSVLPVDSPDTLSVIAEHWGIYTSHIRTSGRKAEEVTQPLTVFDGQLMVISVDPIATDDLNSVEFTNTLRSAHGDVQSVYAADGPEALLLLTRAIRHLFMTR